MLSFLQTSIEFLKGVGTQRADVLKSELGIFTFQDLLEHYPFRYVDRSKINQVRELAYEESYVQLKGYLTKIDEVGVGRAKRLQARFQDSSGQIDLVWFQGIKWVKPTLKLGVLYQIYGKPKLYANTYTIPHPEISEYNEEDFRPGLKGIYHSSEKLSARGLNTKGIEKLQANLAAMIRQNIPETLPQEILQAQNFLSREEAYRQIHFPQTQDLLSKAQFRLKFEELFFLQMELLLKKEIAVRKTQGHAFTEIGAEFNEFYEKHLPFPLTGAQKRVIKEVRADMRTGAHMNRLVQGDVGSGKTIVALLSMLIAVGNGYQATLMAPTEILATQHYESISELLAPMGIEVVLLTGSVKKSLRTAIHEKILDGSYKIVIGTHALLEDVVQYKNLGLVVIDEQHRFGVAQRAKLRKKNTIQPHILVMTATPIPRTLAMTVYGDLDVSVIDELPPGRKPISTSHRFEKDRSAVFGFMRNEIALGRQVYVVYPLILESETMDFNNLMEGYESLSRAFPMPDYQISMVHGQLKPDVKDYEMRRFIEGKTHIMVATTVIEVGVNVPNASVMLIESAERFGLAQLHQLRGRVGRGAEKSYCILMTGSKLSKETKKRMDTMVRTQDGFEIAEVDMELRGPGDMMGTQQSGALNLKIADLAHDGPLLGFARDKARAILVNDPNLQAPEHHMIRSVVVRILKEKPNWGMIS